MNLQWRIQASGLGGPAPLLIFGPNCAQIGLLWRFNSKCPTSIPASFIWDPPPPPGSMANNYKSYLCEKNLQKPLLACQFNIL